MSETQKITVVMSETSSPFPPIYDRPLIYDLNVVDPKDEADVRTKLAQIRYEELSGEEPVDPALLLEIFEGIEIHFCFAGELQTLVDWRG